MDRDTRGLTKTFEKAIPTIARLLLVSTFFEDGIRMVIGWKPQIDYLTVRMGFYLGVIFLVTLSILQIVGSVFVVGLLPKMEYAVYGLLVNVVAQTMIYNLYTDFFVVCRNLALVGSLLMILSEKRAKAGDQWLLSSPFLGKDKTLKYFQFAGRTLLVLVVLSHLPTMNVIVLACVLVPILLVVIGFQTKLSAVILLIVVCAFNLIANSFWLLAPKDPRREFQQYYFFQMISIMGGLLLVVSVGPGDLSVDARRKRE
eukprot:c8824_g1_i1.p1 GENE.c8824_g1_i1~~c8824_g1_i1.p1  ORF type:complete len:267 (+),score=55.12 c8824_g1_i1:32-802(+)